MTANVVFANGNMQDAEVFSLVIAQMFARKGISGRSTAYYEDWHVDLIVENDDEVEYGVRIDVTGLSESRWQALLEALTEFGRRYGGVVIR